MTEDISSIKDSMIIAEELIETEQNNGRRGSPLWYIGTEIWAIERFMIDHAYARTGENNGYITIKKILNDVPNKFANNYYIQRLKTIFKN